MSTSKKFSRVGSRHSAWFAILGILLLGVTALGGKAAYDAISPCSAPKINATREFGDVLVAEYGAQNVELTTYDCDSGSTPYLRFVIEDETAFWRDIERNLKCRPSSSIGDAGENLLDCEFSGYMFVVTPSWASISQV